MGKKKVVIDYDKCKLSGECIKVCPQKAIFIKNGKVVIDYEKFDLDGMCIPTCPENAIKISESD
jgi:NAD-dependent dihydropyrimidine dehydrogenase PreA subunit